MKDENIGIEIVVANTEIGKSGELIKNIMINVSNDLASNADVLIIGVNVEGYIVNAISLLETLVHINDLKGAIIGYEKDE